MTRYLVEAAAVSHKRTHILNYCPNIEATLKQSDELQMARNVAFWNIAIDFSILYIVMINIIDAL